MDNIACRAEHHNSINSGSSNSAVLLRHSLEQCLRQDACWKKGNGQCPHRQLPTALSQHRPDSSSVQTTHRLGPIQSACRAKYTQGSSGLSKLAPGSETGANILGRMSQGCTGEVELWVSGLFCSQNESICSQLLQHSLCVATASLW